MCPEEVRDPNNLAVSPLQCIDACSESGLSMFDLRRPVRCFWNVKGWQVLLAASCATASSTFVAKMGDVLRE
jgi:hypothetical protein